MIDSDDVIEENSSEYGEISVDDSWFNLSPIPKIIIIGDRGCGKSSFINHLLNKSTAESTKSIQVYDLSDSFLDLQIIDTPGLDLNSWLEVTENPNFHKLVENCINLICLFDTNLQLPPSTLSSIAKFINITVKIVPSVSISIILHKLDLSYMGVHKELVNHVRGCLDSYIEVPPRTRRDILYTCTSITDISILFAFTQIVVPHIRVQPELNSLLVEFVSNSLLQRGFIIDKYTRMIIASEPPNYTLQHYEFCCGIIDISSRMMKNARWLPSGKGDEKIGFSSSNHNYNNCVVCYRELTDKLVLIYLADVYKEGWYEHNFECLEDMITILMKKSKDYSIMTQRHVF